MKESSLDRRDFIRRATTTIAGLTFVPLTGCESNLVEPITLGRDLPFITPLSDFFEKVGAEVSIPNWTRPQIAKADWALTIDGMQTAPVVVRYSDLTAASTAGKEVSVLKTIRCVIDSNEVGGLIGTAVWTGIPLTEFVDAASFDAAVKRLHIFGSDGFTNNIKLDRLGSDASSQLLPPLLITHMNGVELPEKHGGPVRLLLNESFGYKNVKWIRRIEGSTSDAPFGTYQDVGFVDDGVIRPVSRITDPLTNTKVPAGALRLTGFAVSGAAPVDTVELQIDGGQWQTARLFTLQQIIADEPTIANAQQIIDGLAYPFRAVWTKWDLDISLTTGLHTIRIRATDSLAQTQPESDTDISDGINAIPEITVEAV